MSRFPATALILGTLGAFAVLSPSFATRASETPVRDGVAPASLRVKLEAQQRARAMTRELVSGILDVQLQQLEENGLAELPIYKDVKAMRASLSGLVEAEMQKVVDLLIEAEDVAPARREALTSEARGMIRGVITRLVLERHNLLRRLKTAELAAQVKRLIDLQTLALEATRSIPAESSAREEQLLLATSQDQRDVTALFLALVETLRDVSTWEGALGAGAAEGLRILKAARVGEELDLALRHLEALDYAAATSNQRTVIKGLRLLLQKIEETQGLIGTDREAALALVRELLRRQTELRDAARKADLKAASTEKLVDSQLALHKDLGKLDPSLEQFPSTLGLLEQAKSAAYDATGRLFDAAKPEALSAQGKVLGSLAQIEEELIAAADIDETDRSAEDHAKMVRALERTRDGLMPIEATQARAVSALPNDPALASREESGAATDVKALGAAVDPPLPASVASRLADAAEALDAAVSALERETTEPARGPAAVEDAGLAIERARAETEATLADAARRETAVRVGELARASEALERAAATEREISRRAERASAEDAEGLSAEDARVLLREHEEARRVAAKVAEAGRYISPELAEALAPALRSMSDASQALDRAAGTPGEASRTPAREAAAATAEAARELSQAASLLRRGVESAAGELATSSATQLQALEGARGTLERLEGSRPESLAERIGRVSDAISKTEAARVEVARASGRQEAARLLERVQAIDLARELQHRADQSAQALAQGRAHTTLDATSDAQKVADALEPLLPRSAVGSEAQGSPAPVQGSPVPAQGNPALAQGSPALSGTTPDPVSSSLGAAREAAIRAARATLDGNPAAATTARTEALEALERARSLADAEAVRASSAPPSAPADAAAQERATRLAAEGRDLARPDAPEAATLLEGARAASETAEGSLRAGSPAASSQDEASSRLVEAGERLREALRALGSREAERLAFDETEAALAARRMAPVDSGATAALRSAAEIAAEGRTSVPSAPSAAASTEEAVSRAYDRAAANLSAHEERVRRDQAAAETLARLAREQEEAARGIEQGREELARTGADAAREAPEGALPLEAANRLADAMESFAAAQDSMGQTAVDLSGQREVANVPLREALEAASGLALARPPSPSEPPSPPPSSSTPPAQAMAQAISNAAAAAASSAPSSPAALAALSADAAASAASPEGPPGRDEGNAGTPAPNAPMGSSFIPASPGDTAAMMAGPSAVADMTNALGAEGQGQGEAQGQGPGRRPSQGRGRRPGQGQGQGEGQGQGQGRGQGVAAGSADSAAASGAVSGGEAVNAGVKEGPLEARPLGAPIDSRTGMGDRDSAAGAGVAPLREEPWSVKLPPALRGAIRAQARKPPPRGYEERLRKYFESLDR